MKTFYVAKVFLSVIIVSCSHKKSTEIFATASGAIGGYDPVSYFVENRPVKASMEFLYKWKDVNWLFSSKRNLDSFAANPEKYAPQYGGWCAYACSKEQGHKAVTDPNAWTIVDGKLYLNHNAEVKELWMKDQKQRIDQADRNWSQIKDK